MGRYHDYLSSDRCRSGGAVLRACPRRNRDRGAVFALDPAAARSRSGKRAFRTNKRSGCATALPPLGAWYRPIRQLAGSKAQLPMVRAGYRSASAMLAMQGMQILAAHRIRRAGIHFRDVPLECLLDSAVRRRRRLSPSGTLAGVESSSASTSACAWRCRTLWTCSSFASRPGWAWIRPSCA